MLPQQLVRRHYGVGETPVTALLLAGRLFRNALLRIPGFGDAIYRAVAERRHPPAVDSAG